jgi:hypothetical protein
MSSPLSGGLSVTHHEVRTQVVNEKSGETVLNKAKVPQERAHVQAVFPASDALTNLASMLESAIAY